MVLTVEQLKAQFAAADGPSSKDWDDLIDTLFGFAGNIDGHRVIDFTLPINRIESDPARPNYLGTSGADGSADWRLPAFGGEMTGSMPNPTIMQSEDHDELRPIMGDNVKDGSLPISKIPIAGSNSGEVIIYLGGVVQWREPSISTSTTSEFTFLAMPIEVYTTSLYDRLQLENEFPGLSASDISENDPWWIAAHYTQEVQPVHVPARAACFDVRTAVTEVNPTALDGRVLKAAIVSLSGTCFSDSDHVNAVYARPYCTNPPIMLTIITTTDSDVSGFGGFHIIPVVDDKFEYGVVDSNQADNLIPRGWNGTCDMRLIGYISAAV